MRAVNGTPPGGLKVLPIDVGVIHFVGIGGIGMSGIAEVLHNLGYRVQGSDVAENASVARLRRLGVAVQVGHREENLGEAAVVVVSSAIRPGNPEIDGARTRRLPVVRRADMLGELMRLKWAIAVAGTHGKTTTTSLIAGLLDAAGLDPTVINGGVINAYGTNARRGEGEWMVVEADESDGTFVRLPACIAVVTNIDPEHLDHYGDFERVREAFEAFIENLPFYGFGALCIDHPEVQALLGRVSDRRTVTYGFSPQADIRALDASFDATGAVFDVALRDRTGRADRQIPRLRLAMPGLHNVQNALAAIAVARELGLDDDVVRRAFATFGGVGRRFTRTGVVGGVTVIDDYGHHPVEIRAVLATARGAYPDGRVVAVVQPHRFTRLQALFEEFCTCFNDADTVFVADVYAAGEAPIAGVDRDALVDGLKRHGHRDARPLPGPEALADAVAACAGPGDVVVCLGAGSITAWAHALPRDLARALGTAEVEAREGAA